MKSISKFLNKNIYFPNRIDYQILTGIIVFFLLLTFLKIYSPFGINNLNTNPLTIAFYISLMSSFIIFLFLFLSIRFFKYLLHKEKFTNKALLIISIIILIFAAVFNFLYLDTVTGIDPYLMTEKLTLLLIDIVIFPSFIIANYINWKKKTFAIIEISAFEKKKSITSIDHSPKLITVCNLENDVVFQFDVEDFVFASSNENYCEIYVYNQGIISKSLIRITFIGLFELLKDNENCIRCHRTRIVNLCFASNIVKEGKRTYLILNGVNERIPVAQKYPIEKHFNIE